MKKNDALKIGVTITRVRILFKKIALVHYLLIQPFQMLAAIVNGSGAKMLAHHLLLT
jgi:hypothetical protein